MSWNDSGTGVTPPPEGRVKVAALAIVIIVVFLIGAAITVHVANSHGSHKAAVNSTSTTGPANSATANSGATATTALATTGNSVPTTALDPDSPEGNSYTPRQLAANYPQKQSNLSAAEFTQATNIANAFVTANSTGQGADAFEYFFSNGYQNTPWVGKDFQIEWVYANSDTRGIVKATVWFTGTSLVTGKALSQVSQAVYLDETNSLQVIHQQDLHSRGVYVPPECCITISS